MEIRLIDPVDPADHAAQFRLGAEAFGAPPYPATVPDPPTTRPPGREVWGAFDGGTLLARVAAHSYESWWHGRRLATSGIAGVTVAPEHRGEGLLHPLFQAVLEAAAGREEAVSTLYPTANGIYRSLGYELVASYDTVEIPTHELTGVRAPATTRTQRAQVADIASVRALYDAWASAQNGPLTRTGPRFATTDAELLAGVTGVSLAVDGDEVVGFATWDRGEDYDPATSVIEVHDLVATSLDGYRALWRMFASYSSVVGRLHLSTSGDDAARLVLPTSTWRVVSRHPYMLRVSDPAAALTSARLALPGLAPTRVAFAVAGDRLGRADGCYTLHLGSEPGICERVAPQDDVPTFTTQGLALAFAGAQSCANLRLVGHLTGPDTHDRLLDAVLGGRPLHVRDYF
ncbi:GNAT family N-acetyltransferase [Nocardioides sp.]|uniref:GNAT family N-acetyltransferase n=1 Tax=Nocardioides sp. TaxID=35761 RepID=UPI003219B892